MPLVTALVGGTLSLLTRLASLLWPHAAHHLFSHAATPVLIFPNFGPRVVAEQTELGGLTLGVPPPGLSGARAVLWMELPFLSSLGTVIPDGALGLASCPVAVTWQWDQAPACSPGLG